VVGRPDAGLRGDEGVDRDVQGEDADGRGEDDALSYGGHALLSP
jgi:hypothetical protein